MTVDEAGDQASDQMAIVDPRALAAAANNADLYEAVFAAHDLSFVRKPHAFVAFDRPPPFYSNLTVLSSEHTAEIEQDLGELAERFDGRLGVKDSFGRLGLAPNGFRVLFEASWIWREEPHGILPSGWQKVESVADLHLWETGWKRSGSPTDQRMFPAKILRRGDVCFLGRKVGDAFEAGCIANASPECVGISNVFSTDPAERVFDEAANAVTSISQNKPIVGYESGELLQHSQSAGFQTVGDLRILVTDAAVF